MKNGIDELNESRLDYRNTKLKKLNDGWHSPFCIEDMEWILIDRFFDSYNL